MMARAEEPRGFLVLAPWASSQSSRGRLEIGGGMQAEPQPFHVCRGNWSRNESTLLRGGYRPLKPYLEQVKVDQLVLEYATDRAGDLLKFEGKELGLGVVNPRTGSR